VSIVTTALHCVLLVALVPTAVLFLEVALAAVGGARRNESPGERRRLVVLIPAHNEAAMISDTLASIRPQLKGGDRIVVVADNCTDDTATIAAAQGAQAVRRDDLERRGKGFALDYGVRHLESDPPDVVVIVDADCRLAEGCLDRLARQCVRTQRPAQGTYLMQAGPAPSLKLKIAQFAWLIKNRVRPLGLDRLGLPCLLTGSGMAFPWSLIQSAELASGHIVEDMKLGLDLARAGAAPLYCPDALILSEFARGAAGADAQRTRWEHGHLVVILAEVPRLLWNGIRHLRLGSLVLAAEVAVPPLALLAAMVAVSGIVSVGALIFADDRSAVVLSAAAAALLLAAVMLGWWRFGRGIVSMSELSYAAFYALAKLPVYWKFLVARQTAWVRSHREEKK
jgi:glycosyltransferase involved in cell wall biosynthesis